MRKADLKKCCASFQAHLDEIRTRHDLFFNAQRVIGRPAEKRWGFEMLAVNAVTAWEVFVEDIFLGCVNRSSAALSATLGLELPAHLPLAVCEALFTTRGFLSFRSIADLKGQAKRFIGQQHPFASIGSADERHIDGIVALRNYIVHDSQTSRNRYKRDTLQPVGITRIRAPGSFLLTVTQGKTRLARSLDALESAKDAIAAAL